MRCVAARVTWLKDFWVFRWMTQSRKPDCCITTTLAWLSACLSLLAVHRHCGVPPAPGTLLRTGLVALVAFVLSNLWHASGGWAIVELALMTGVVIGGLFLLGELTGHDLAFAQSLLVRERRSPS